MVRGLLWLPLLVLFIWLTWAGWNEFLKVEAYKLWAQQFERAKYDIYAVLGQQGNTLIWGLPTRKGVINTETLDLTDVTALAIEVNSQPVDPEALPAKGRFTLAFTMPSERVLSVPFTEGAIARQWFDFLRDQWELPVRKPC